MKGFYNDIIQKIFKLELSYEDFVSKNLNLSAIGKTQEIKFNILPDIEPKHVNILIISLSLVLISSMFIFPNYSKISENKKSKNYLFIKYLILSSLIFYNFGFHVHEKAFIIISLLVIIYNFIQFSDSEYEETIIANKPVEEEKKEKKFDVIPSADDLKMTTFNFLFRSALYIGTLSQMPLIQSKKDYFLKLFLCITYFIFMEIYFAFSRFQAKVLNKIKLPKPSLCNKLALLSLLLLIIFVFISDFTFVFLSNNSFEKEYNYTIPMYMQYNHTEIAHNKYIERINKENVIENISANLPFLKDLFAIIQRFEFLPLMLISVINAVYVQILNLLSLRNL